MEEITPEPPVYDVEEVAQNYCIWTRPGGQRCRAYARHGSELCYWHDPATEAERATGFRQVDRTPKSQPVLPEAVTLDSATAVHELLQRVANYVATAERPDIGRAQTLGTLGAHLLRALSLRQLEAELESAREQLAELQWSYDLAQHQLKEAWASRDAALHSHSR